MDLSWAVPLSIAGFTMIDALERWYRSFDADVGEADLLPLKRASWGTIRAMGSARDMDRRYFFVQLPGVYWERDMWTADRYGWHHRGLLWIQDSSFGWRGWREIFIRCSVRTGVQP